MARQLPSCRAHARRTERLGRHVPYGSDGNRAQVLDIFAPKDPTEPLPVVLYIHGGGFSLAAKETHTHVAQRIAAAGYVVFNIDYRLGAEGAFPAGLEDSCAALHWVLDHAADYGGDPERLAYAGESAGANLILALSLVGAHPFPAPFAQALYERHPKPLAILPACGMLEVHRAERFIDNEALRPLFRKRIAAVCRGYLRNRVADDMLASPLAVLEGFDELPARGFPAIYTVCGGADPILDDSDRLEAARQRLGIEGGYHVEPDQVHAYHLFPWLAAMPSAWRRQMDFLDRVVAPGMTG